MAGVFLFRHRLDDRVAMLEQLLLYDLFQDHTRHAVYLCTLKRTHMTF